MKLVSTEVNKLQEDMEKVKTGCDEAKKINHYLDNVIREIDKFNKGIADIKSQIKVQQEEQSEKNETFSRDIAAISHEVTEIDSRVKALESSCNCCTEANVFQLPSRNPCFCGRDSELETIAVQLKKTENSCAHAAICGLGGVGKTSLAVEYLWRSKEEYPGGIFWISGENKELFQISLCEIARQVGTFENEFSNSLSGTLNWLQRCKKLWCLVIDNLDELELSMEMRKLLSGHWKQTARGHIIITTRREVLEVEEEMGIEGCCYELKCMTVDEGVQFLHMRTGRTDREVNEMRELVRELDGLPLALDQASAYIRCVCQTVKEYVKKYKERKLELLKKKKARHLVENTSRERLAVHTTWLLNFDHISRISEKMDLGGAPTLVMQISAFVGPDDIPYELVNDGLKEDNSSNMISSSWDPAEIVSLLTKFSLFQRYGTDSFSVHRVVQEVIRSRLEKEKKEHMHILSLALRVLHHAFVNTRSPAEVCKSFTEDTVFSVENPPSLYHWGKLASHATYLQEHLRNFSKEHTESVRKLLYREESVRVFNEAAIFFGVSHEKIKAQMNQKLKLSFLSETHNSTSAEHSIFPQYFIDIPLSDRDYKLISHCMRQRVPELDEMAVPDFQKKKQEEANRLREKGNLAIKSKNYQEALELYSNAINVLTNDHRLFYNRALCYLKLGESEKALDDCEECLSLMPFYSKALHRKAWALHELVKSGNDNLAGHKKATAAMAVHFDPELRRDKTFCRMFPEVPYTEISDEKVLTFVLMTRQESVTILLHEGHYTLTQIVAVNDLQIVGLVPKVVLMCTERCSVIDARCYFENIVFPKGNVPLVCNGKGASVHINHCEVSGGFPSCEDYPECNGGRGCIAKSLGKTSCDRTGKFGVGEPSSGIGGEAGIQIFEESSGLIESSAIHDCGGGGALVVGEGSRLVATKCKVYKNHQAGLEAREGGKLNALGNVIYGGRYHGILIGPDAGDCVIDGNKIFENAIEGILGGKNKNQVEIRNNDIHHNRAFGISLEYNSSILVYNNKIFENGFWGILASARTSVHIKENVISGNKCGGIFIGINYSGRVHLESNTVRDHSGPWLEYKYIKSNLEVCSFLSLDFPSGENKIYTDPPILNQNTEFNNMEGMYHPREVVERFQSGCTYCHRSKNKGVCTRKCSMCHMAAYCNEECQSKHWPTHKALCNALRTRYSVTVDLICHDFDCSMNIVSGDLKGAGEGPEPKRNSRQRFIVKIQTGVMNSHPLQQLTVYDQSRTVQGEINSPEVVSVIMECGVLRKLDKFTSKKCFFWAKFAEGGDKLTVFLDHLAPYQEW